MGFPGNLNINMYWRGNKEKYACNSNSFFSLNEYMKIGKTAMKYSQHVVQQCQFIKTEDN